MMIPSEIVTDIISRLPVKSLLRFKCVSRLWYSIIDSPDFVKMHLRRSTTTNSNQRLILEGLGLYSVDLDSLDKAHVVKPPFYYKSVDGISNSCNGLILVMSDPPVLWNPFSTKFRILPDNPIEYPTPLLCFSKVIYALAYDSRKDDYKVVRVVEFRNKTSHMWECSEVEIYSMKSNSWNRIEGFPYPLPFLKGNWGVHVNGALHTLVEDYFHVYSEKSIRIMAFSVESEKHYEVMLPPNFGIKNVKMKLDVLGGCLCLVCTSKSRANVWVMKEYGVEESWIKLISINSSTIDPDDILQPFAYLKPLAYSKNGENVLVTYDDKRLVWYNLRTKTIKNVSVSGLPFVFFPEVCVESLISPCGPAPREVDGVKRNGKDKAKEKKTKKNRDDFLSEGFKLVL
ncbi:F-box CPR30-like [Olea europaea subsp. europaea]|uniref:F-box CPR30-like n=1 Tax=Olea europaea subsp. europaea TaxID=158383 RepID=A0A8S0PVW3_OLEEU|nr:F-box CPR30-like [Olea europaea subsp. europaea]